MLYVLSWRYLWIKRCVDSRARAQTERGNTRGGATKKMREISRTLLSINLHFSVHPYRISVGSCGACSLRSWTSRRRQSCGRRPGRAAAADRTTPQTRTPATAPGGRRCCRRSHLHFRDDALFSSRKMRSGRRGRGCASGRMPWWPRKNERLVGST